MKVRIDHIGWVTNNLQKFEDFWVKILGFRKIWESYLSPEMAKILYGVEHGAMCIRYKKGNLVIECHVFDQTVTEKEPRFKQFGLNHIALHVSSRKKFLKQYPFKTHIYHNPKGWDNIFIRDFEGNWIELKETFTKEKK